MSRSLRIVGFDPSLRHWGIAIGSYDRTASKLTIDDLRVIEPVIPKGKQVRASSKDLAAATQLHDAAYHAAQQANVVFIEIPGGAQSARGALGNGVCFGVLGSLRAQGVPFFELTPTDVKVAAINDKKASKQQMIDWATQAHPEAPWPTYKSKGATLIVNSKAEHMADAIGAIYAGLASEQFKQILQFSPY